MNKAEFIHRFHLFPLLKKTTDDHLIHHKNPPQKAAVLVTLFEKNNQMHVLFTLRAKHLKYHPSQVCFPGGKIETFDKNEIATALRETHEEIGLSHDKVTILGQLNPYQTITGFNVMPIVGIIEDQLKLNINKNEVAEVFTVPLQHFLNFNNHLTITKVINNNSYEVTFIPYQKYNIWGATAAILKDLAAHLIKYD